MLTLRWSPAMSVPKPLRTRLVAATALVAFYLALQLAGFAVVVWLWTGWPAA